MEYKLFAKYVRKRFESSSKDQSPDYFVYEFTDIIDTECKELGSKWFKETKLLKKANLKPGERYEIILSEKPYPNAINLPYPKEIVWAKEKIYIKNGNCIIYVDENGIETILTNSRKLFYGTN